MFLDSGKQKKAQKVNIPEAKYFMPSAQYASNEDFCHIFCEGIDSLFCLSFLLTADREKAEQCFVCALEDSVMRSLVFREWARSWARRAIIQNAVQLIDPHSMEGDAPSTRDRNGELLAALPPEIVAVLELPVFDRFVYVISVLERCSDHESAILLGCAARDVIATRVHAFRQIETALAPAGDAILRAS